MKKRKGRGKESALAPASPAGAGGEMPAVAKDHGSQVPAAATPDAASAAPTMNDARPDGDPLPVAAEANGAQPMALADDAETNRIGLATPAAGDDPALETTTQDPEEAAEGALFFEAVPDLDAAVSATGSADEEEAAALGESAAGAGTGEDAEPLPEVEGSRLESIIESLLFAADRPLVLNELKRLLGERDGKRVSQALESLHARHADSGIQLVSVAGGWQLRTHPANGAWVAKLVAGRPTRLSRAMMETLAIVAYRQPITRPEIDEIRGVDCGPVLRTLLDRALIRVIGKKEEVGRPILYGTTPEFLKIFSLRDLADLPTLREFHELGADDRAKVDATVGTESDVVATADGAVAGSIPRAGELPEVDTEEEDSLIEALEQATHAAGRAERSLTEPEAAEEAAAARETDSDRAAPAQAADDGLPAGDR